MWNEETKKSLKRKLQSIEKWPNLLYNFYNDFFSYRDFWCKRFLYGHPVEKIIWINKHFEKKTKFQQRKSITFSSCSSISSKALNILLKNIFFFHNADFVTIVSVQSIFVEKTVLSNDTTLQFILMLFWHPKTWRPPNRAEG